MDNKCSKFLKQYQSDLKKYKKIYIGTTDLDWNLIDNVEKKINIVKNTNTYIAVGGSYLFPLATWYKNHPKNLIFIDRNKTMLSIYKFFVFLIKHSKNRKEFLENLYNLDFPNYELNYKSMSKWLKIKQGIGKYTDLQKSLYFRKLQDEFCVYVKIIYPLVTKKSRKRQLYPCWNGDSKFSINKKKLRVSKNSSFFASTLWYNVCGYLKNDKTYENVRKILKKAKINYIDANLLELDKMKKYMNLKKNIYMFITNADDGIAYLETEQLCNIIKNKLKEYNFKNKFYVNSVLTGIHIITQNNILYDDTKIKYEKKIIKIKQRNNTKKKLGLSYYNIDVICEKKQNNNPYFTIKDISNLLNSNLKKIKSSEQGDIYQFNKNNKNFILKITDNNEQISSKIIAELLEQKQIPNLYVNFYSIAQVKNKNKTKNVLIMEKIQNEAWNLIDSKNINIVKSCIIPLLISIWNLNHIANIYHGDICAIRGKKGLALHNIMYNKVKNQNIKFKLDDLNINLNNCGNQIKIIDFGTSFKINEYDEQFKKLNLNKYLYEIKKLKDIKFKSEILTIIYCLLNYYKFDNIDDILSTICNEIIKKNNIKNVKDFDKHFIKYLNNNFKSFFKSFSYIWPTGSYYGKNKNLIEFNINLDTKLVLINKKNLFNFINQYKLKKELISLGKYYYYQDQKNPKNTFNYNNFFGFKLRGVIVLIFYNNKLIGMRQYNYLKNNKGLFIHKFCVYKDFRGKGFGGILHKTLKKYFKSLNFEYLRADVIKSNELKLKFDKKHNAKIVGETDKHFKIVYEI